MVLQKIVGNSSGYLIDMFVNTTTFRKSNVLAYVRVYYSKKAKSTPDNAVLIRGDVVGPPNPVSNIRPITFHVPQNETSFERAFRLEREHVQSWHEEFWSHHNERFVKERKEFEKIVQNNRPENCQVPLSADEISIFYKSFLDKYWKTHLWYNMEWYKKNLGLLTLAFRVEMDRLKRKLLNNYQNK